MVPVSKDQFLVSASTSSITGDITHPRGDVDYWLFRLVSHIVPTGVKQSEASGKGFLVYPTVTDGLLHAQLPAQGGGSYYVYHISGKLVSQGLLSSGDGQISLGGLVPGMYLVRLDQSGSTYHSRILVK